MSRTFLGLLAGLFLLSGLAAALPAQAAFVNYDFRSAAAQTALDGQLSGIFTVGGVPLGVEAGVADGSGNFTTGADTLSTDPVNGLGVNGEDLRDVRGSGGLLTTGVRFALDPAFTAGNIATLILESFFSEHLVVYTDGTLFGQLFDGTFNDFPFLELLPGGGLTQVVLGPLAGKSTLLVTTSVALNDDSDFSIAALQGIPIPEPATGGLFVVGLLALGVLRRRWRGAEV